PDLAPGRRVATHPGLRRRTPLVHRRGIPDQQRRLRSRPVPDPLLARLAPAHHPGHGHARHHRPGRPPRPDTAGHRTRHRRLHPDPGHRQRGPTPDRRADPPHTRHRPGTRRPHPDLVKLATTTPSDRPGSPLPTPTRHPEPLIYNELKLPY